MNDGSGLKLQRGGGQRSGSLRKSDVPKPYHPKVSELQIVYPSLVVLELEVSNGNASEDYKASRRYTHKAVRHGEWHLRR